jgi:hypothetical protein
MRRRAAQSWRYPAFFHALLDRGAYPPPSAFEAWFCSAAHDERALGRVAEALPFAAEAAAPRGASLVTRTLVHLLQHGEVHNPQGVLYGRLPGLPAVRGRVR